MERVRIDWLRAKARTSIFGESLCCDSPDSIAYNSNRGRLTLSQNKPRQLFNAPGALYYDSQR